MQIVGPTMNVNRSTSSLESKSAFRASSPSHVNTVHSHRPQKSIKHAVHPAVLLRPVREVALDRQRRDKAAPYLSFPNGETGAREFIRAVRPGGFHVVSDDVL